GRTPPRRIPRWGAPPPTRSTARRRRRAATRFSRPRPSTGSASRRARSAAAGGLSPTARGVVLRYQLAHTRDQLLAILDRVGPRIVAPDQEAGGAELVILEQCLRDRLGCADERGRIPLRAGRDGERCPQTGVMHLGLGSRRQETFRPDILAVRRRRPA